MARTYGQSRLGFTLVELLIVVAILGVLAAVLLPSLSRARHIARLAACKAQLHAQTRAHTLYGSNNNDNKPALYVPKPRFSRKDWVSPRVKWTGTPVGQGILVVGEYMPFEALLCPSESMFRDVVLDTEAWQELDDSGSSYAYFWRHPDSADDPTRPDRGATYQRAIDNSRSALAMDINCATGHHITGEYEGRAWPSHPPLDRVNVSFATGVVIDAHSDEVRLEPPAGPEEELAWFDKAHKLR